MALFDRLHRAASAPDAHKMQADDAGRAIAVYANAALTRLGALSGEAGADQLPVFAGAALDIRRETEALFPALAALGNDPMTETLDARTVALIDHIDHVVELLS